MSDKKAQYARILEKREQDAYTIMIEAEKHYRQATTNYNIARMDRIVNQWEEEEQEEGMEQSGIYTEQENDGTRNTL